MIFGVMGVTPFVFHVFLFVHVVSEPALRMKVKGAAQHEPIAALDFVTKFSLHLLERRLESGRMAVKQGFVEMVLGGFLD